ncbi:MAG: trigger factor [Pseudomonadota bacterium]
MQIEETKNEGLARAYSITIPADDIEQKITAQVDDLRKKMRMPGFRPGKVPPKLIRRLHGDALRGQVMEEAINETTQKLIEDKELRPAGQPNFDIKESEAGEDVSYVIELEVLPEIELPDLAKIKLDKPVAPAAKAQIDEQINKIAENQKSYKAAAKTYKAKDGDAVLIDFVGKIDGEAFDGGAADGHQLVLGSNSFIPGFEEQLVGVKAGDEKNVEVSFPEDYGAEELAGKPAVFETKVQEVQKPEATKIDDEFAKNLGLDDLAGLKKTISEQIEREHSEISRTVLKRRLLDALADQESFAVPPSMVDAEFEQIWSQLMGQVEGDEKSELENNEAEKADYRAIAERRVRLGLLLAEIGQKNDIQVKQDEVNRLISMEAQRFPGQEQAVMEFYRKNPQAMAQLRAPLYEDKVVDFILEMASLTEIKTDREGLDAIIKAQQEQDEAGLTSEEQKVKGGGAKAKKAAKPKKAAKKAEE